MPRIRTCTLIITRGCNLNCTYCYERHKDRESMSREMALHIMAQELQRAEKDGYATLHVSFMGGEPFLNFDVIKCVVDWFRKQTTRIRLEAYATTNGTRITDEIKEWLVANSDLMKVQISYDGDELQQKINRTDKYIDLDFFLNTFPMQGVHITVSKATLPSLSQGVFSVLARGARCSTNLACGTKWSDEDAQIYLRELRMLAEGFLTRFADKEPIPALNRSLGLVGSVPQPMPSCRDCIDCIAYDVDGVVYPCHLFSPIVVGTARTVKFSEFESDDELERYGGKIDHSCDGCVLRSWCQTCYGFNYLFTGSTGRRDHSACKMMFAQAFTASEYQIRHFKVMGITEANAHMARSAIRAYRVLRSSKVLKEILNGIRNCEKLAKQVRKF